MKTIAAVLLVLAACLALASCNNSTQPPTGLPDISGVHRGLVDFYAPNDTVHVLDSLETVLRLTQSGKNLSGTWTILLSTGDSLTGTVQGGTLDTLGAGYLVHGTLLSTKLACNGSFVIDDGTEVDVLASPAKPYDIEGAIDGSVACYRGGQAVHGVVVWGIIADLPAPRRLR